MRKHSRKSNFRNDTLSLPSTLLGRNSGPLPSTMTPPSTFPIKKRRTEFETFSLSIESHITIRPQVELSRKRLSLLLEQEIVRVSAEGFNLLDYFSFEWILNYLVGSQKFERLNGKKLTIVVYIAKIILLSYKNNWTFLYRKEGLDSRLKEIIEESLGSYSDRKYQGRHSVYQLEKFLMVKIEDVNSVFERSLNNSVRYSSYCKGYGEGGHSARKQKTRYSPELDRDDSENEIPEEFYSFGKSIHYQEELFLLEQQILEEKKR